MSRRNTTPELTVISWRDIPAQVVARAGRHIVKRELTPRFQLTIDRAAMKAGLDGTDDYLSEWRRTSRPCDHDLERAAGAEVERIESTFTTDVLRALAENGGLDRPQHPPSSTEQQ